MQVNKKLYMHVALKLLYINLEFLELLRVETFDNDAKMAGLGFKIDEIVQAWNEMYDAKRWQIGVPSFRLEPLFRRRVPRLHHILENIRSFG